MESEVKISIILDPLDLPNPLLFRADLAQHIHLVDYRE